MNSVVPPPPHINTWGDHVTSGKAGWIPDYSIHSTLCTMELLRQEGANCPLARETASAFEMLVLAFKAYWHQSHCGPVLEPPLL